MDGATPTVALIQGSDKNFYGSTSAGGANGQGGTIFEITPTGTLTTLYSFCAEVKDNLCIDGDRPGGLTPGASGIFYGATTAGGRFNKDTGSILGDGTVFSFQVTE